ncbi:MULTISPECIES: ADP-ribosyltransferase [Streptomyces]|uniref:Pierisin-like domain-containing protein n=1 Tax=Streptomyces lycii TaxID=2654337 RepID=A0ABQ7FLT7_9ACTN|nr:MULTISPECIES: ADP-ribosyltransferase [Streptomyces]KAF4409917.1 hypothetical protein GCU69_06540 [Streptomyces lycii]PGH48638.1 hypothetical protein CRI70_22095 [Streptomyces sp. Ru87]
MTTTRLRRRVAALVFSCAAVLTAAAPATSAEAGAETRTAAPARAAAPAVAAARAATAAPAAADCPVHEPLYAAADRRVDIDRITPDPVYRTSCKTLYRADGRPPAVIFEQGFHPKAPVDGQYDLARYVDVNQPSPFVSTSYDHDLYKTWWKSGWNYYIDAPGGIDVNETIGDDHRWAEQQEVAFPGGIAREFVVGVCPVDARTKTEIMNECLDNPHYRPEL